MVLSDLITALTAVLQTNVGCTFVHGFPTWGRTSRDLSSLPIGAVQISGLNMASRSQGRHNPLRAATWDLWIFARNEVELVDLLDAFRTWAAVGEFVVNDSRVRVTVTTVERHLTDTAVQQEQHGFAITILTEW